MGVLGEGVERPLTSRSLPLPLVLMAEEGCPPSSTVTSSDFFLRPAQARLSLLPFEMLSLDEATGVGRERLCPICEVKEGGARGAEDLERAKKRVLEADEVAEGKRGRGSG